MTFYNSTSSRRRSNRSPEREAPAPPTALPVRPDPYGKAVTSEPSLGRPTIVSHLGGLLGDTLKSCQDILERYLVRTSTMAAHAAAKRLQQEQTKPE